MGKPKGTFSVPRSFDSEQKRFAQLLNESVAVLKGELGDPLDAAVTYNDLINSGIAKRDLRIGSNGFIGGGGGGIIPGDGPVLDIPPAPTGVQVNGAFQNILIQWDKPTFFGFSYAEVWAATSNTFADRVLVGTSTASLFSHQVGNGQTRYYWVRFVNTQDVAGPFNSTTGIGDSTVIDIGAQMSLLSEQLQNLPGYTALTTLITNGDVATAAVAAVVIKSTSSPTTRDNGDSLSANDIWIDTNDNNQAYFRNASNNSWVAARDSNLISLYNSLSSTVTTNTSNISTAQSDIVTLTSDTTANASAITSLTSTVNSNTSAIATEQTTRANADTALATDITNLTSTVSGNTSAISTEATTRANADSALATDITNLTSTVNSNTSAISTEATTRANADTANATAISNLSSTVGTTNSNVSTLQTSVSNLEGDADAMFVIQVATESNGSKSAAGMVIGSNASSGSGAQSYVQFQADKFAIWSGSTNVAPFIVNSGTVFIKDAMIENGAITNAKIQDATIDNAKITATLDAAKITAGTLSADRLDASVILSTDLATNTSTSIHGGNIITNTLNADKIVTNSITGTQINVDTLNVRHFDNVSSDIKSHTGAFVPLGVFGSSFQRGSTNFTTQTSTTGTYLSTTIGDVRNNAKYQAIWTGVYGDCTNGVLEYSVNGSTWVQAGGGIQNVTFSAGTFRTYVFAYSGDITGLSGSSTTVYWRVRWITKLRSTYQSLYVFIDNTQ
jgi:hypothetical protein